MNTKKRMMILRYLITTIMLFGEITSLGLFNTSNVKAQSTTVPLLSNDLFFADADINIPAIQTFLNKQPGMLKSQKFQVGNETQLAATVLMGNVEYHNISPKVLLTLLEMKSGILSTVYPSSQQLEYPMGHIESKLVGLPLQVDWAASELVKGFNSEYLKPLQFTDGTKIKLPNSVNRAAYSIYRFLSFDTTYKAWQTLTEQTSPSGFIKKYQQYWVISPSTITSIKNSDVMGLGYNPFLIEPFHGSHSINSYFDHEYPDYSTNGSMVIYTGQRGDYYYDGHDAIDYNLNYETVYASASGTVIFASTSTNYCWVTGQNETALVVTIQHSNGYRTSYWHLNRIDVNVGQTVSQDQQIGQSGQTGCVTGPHLHFSVRRDVGGTYRITDPYGWDGSYTEPCTQNSTCAASDYLFFRPDSTPPTTTPSFSGTAGENNWYQSAVQITLSAVDNSGGSGVSQIKYQIDSNAGTWLTYSSAPIPVSTNGIHTVYYKSVDAIGNWEAEKSTSFKIDATAPTGSVSIQNGSPQTYSVSVDLTAQGSDANSGLAAVHFRDAGQTVWSGWVAPGSTLWQLVGAHGQTANVEAQFKDNAGNLSAVVSDNIVLNFYPANPSSSLYKLQRSTIGSVGLHAASAQYNMNGTAGQPSIVGVMQGTNYRLNSGYWAQALITQVPPTKTSTPTITRTNTPNITKTITTTPTITKTLTQTITATLPQTNTPTNTQTPTAIITTFASIGSQDGWVLESGETTNLGGTINNTATTINLGDDASKKQYRGILSFSTGALPDNAVISGIKLKIQKSTIVGGGNPVKTFQGFMVDIKNGLFGKTALQITDFQTTASKSYGPFTPALVGNWYAIDLTSANTYINKLTANAGLTQIRLRFKLDDNNNTVANYLSLYSGNASAANRPQLVISYYIP